MGERNLVAVSIKHTIYGWKFGMPCWLWGSRTKDEEKRSFGGYTQYPNNAEVYSLEEWQESGYGAGDVCKVDVQQLAGGLNHAAQCVAEGYVTWADIRQMLKEYGVETALE